MEVAAVAGPIVKLLPKLLSVMDKKMKQLDSLEVDAGFIRRDLQSIQDIIGRSSGGSISDLWIRDLRSLADDMEDCIDSFQVGKTTRISFVAKIAKLKKRSQDTLEQLQNSISIAGAAAPPAAADPQAGGSGDPEEELVALLGRSQSEEQEGKLKVISVAGFGGLGMTRLAQKVYSDRDVRSQFPLRAWVRAPPGMSVHKLLQEIHDQLMPILHTKKQVAHGASPSSSRSKPQVNGDAEHGASASSSKSIPQVNRDVEHGQSASHVHRLAEILKTGRYLIVIDDVNTHELYDVLSAFSWADGVDGRIIMTTAIQLPAATCCRCGDGSPLAMDSTSQVFIGELTESGFVETCLHLRDDTLARMQRRNNEILSSPVVQDLLLYFCMFPRDHPVRRNPLIRRWLAEGLVFPQPETESISQDVAAKNLESLISRNVIQPIQVRNYGNVKKCQTSGMMLNSISSKSKSQNFITMLCGSQTAKNPLGNVRRLSLHLNDAENGPLNLPKDLSRLHTLAVFPNDANVARHQANLNYANYKLLRVLDLKECADVKAEHVGKICDLLLLKYLSFGDSIDKLPRKIAKLKWLETLDMRRTRVVALPIEVLQLPELKHLLGKFQLREGDHTPKKLEKLLTKESSSELQKLSGFVTSKSEGFAQLMSRMGNLRKVKIWCDSMADVTKLADLVEAMKKFIREGLDMTRVDRSLSIDIQGCPAECSELFMDSLQATGRLTSLKLRGNLTRLPRFQAKLNYIEELCLSRTNLSGDTILSCLSALRMTLKYLKLVEDKLEHLVIEPEHFRSLKGICLVGEQSLEDITIQARAMPYLVSLHVICEALGDLPGIEITSMSGLKEVALHSAVRDSIKDGWQAAAVNHPNRPNVLFIHPADSWHRDPPPCGTKGKTASETKPIATRIASSIKGGIFSFTQRAS